MDQLVAWLQVNWMVALAVVVYMVVNFYPRKHPDDQSGVARWFWFVLDRVSILSAEKVPGRFKMLFAASPREPAPAPNEEPDPPATTKDSKEQKP